jgi:hypothetical protein
VNQEEGGWPDEQVVAPSALAYDEKHADPREITKEEILQIEVRSASARPVDVWFSEDRKLAAKGDGTWRMEA